MSAKTGTIKNCLECGKEIYVKKCLLKRKKYCSRVCMGKNTPLAKGNIPKNTSAWNKGKKLHYSVWNKGLKGYMAGDKNGNWKGGKTALMDSIRTCTKYKSWRTSCFVRDNYTCVKCLKRGKGLCVDHITPLAALVDYNKIKSLKEAKTCDKLWQLNNGRTLCKTCHKQTDTFGVNYVRWNKSQEFIK